MSITKNQEQNKLRQHVYWLFHPPNTTAVNIDMTINRAMDLTGMSRSFITKWKDRKELPDGRRKRKSRITRSVKKFMVKNFANKGFEKQVYPSQAAFKIQRFLKRETAHIRLALKQKLARLKASAQITEASEQIKQCKTEMQQLRKRTKCSKALARTAFKNTLGKPLRPRKGIELTPEHKKARVLFCEMVKREELTGRDIFFTDESRFERTTFATPSHNCVYLTKDVKEDIKQGSTAHDHLFIKTREKYPETFMIAGGSSYYGLGNIIFCGGYMDSTSYHDTLLYYADDIRRLEEANDVSLYFQQDNASAHTSKASKAFIEGIFTKSLSFWPANSPDLSPIEQVWGILKAKIARKKFPTLATVKRYVIKLWDNFPERHLHRIFDSFVGRCEYVRTHGGCEYRKQIGIKRKKSLPAAKWEKGKKQEYTNQVVRMAYNDQTLAEIMNVAIRHTKQEAHTALLVDIGNFCTEKRIVYDDEYVMRVVLKIATYVAKCKQCEEDFKSNPRIFFSNLNDEEAASAFTGLESFVTQQNIVQRNISTPNPSTAAINLQATTMSINKYQTTILGQPDFVKQLREILRTHNFPLSYKPLTALLSKLLTKLGLNLVKPITARKPPKGLVVITEDTYVKNKKKEKVYPKTLKVESKIASNKVVDDLRKLLKDKTHEKIKKPALSASPRGGCIDFSMAFDSAPDQLRSANDIPRNVLLDDCNFLPASYSSGNRAKLITTGPSNDKFILQQKAIYEAEERVEEREESDGSESDYED